MALTSPVVSAPLGDTRPSQESKDAVLPLPELAVITPDHTPAVTPEVPCPPAVTIVPGYRPSILARTLEMHMDYYHPAHGFGREFEAALATGLGDLLKRLDRPGNQVWSAVVACPVRDPLTLPPVERIVGVVFIDSEWSGAEGVARLRAFIVDESVRGLGVGKRLFRAAMEFVREFGFRECHLATLHNLTVARRLYENEGFKHVSEHWWEGFGKRVMELDYVWHRQDLLDEE